MRKIALALLFLLLSLLPLTGCGEKENPIIGSWQAELELADVLTEAFAQDEEMGPYLQIRSFPIQLQTVFREDGTYSMSVDHASAESAMSGLMEDLRSSIEDYLNAAVAEYGGTITAEEILAEDGTSMDALMAEMELELSSGDLLSVLNGEGKYLAENGRLYLSDSIQTEAGANGYETYVIEGEGADQTLTLTAGESGGENELEPLYPMVFHRAG